MPTRKSPRTIVALVLFAILAACSSVALADEAKVPQTQADHEAMAKQYREEAAQYKKIGDDHRAMAEAYKKQVALPVNKGGQKNPWLVKMEKHCDMLAKDADKLAADATKAAEYHDLRAKELQGK